MKGGVLRRFLSSLLGPKPPDDLRWLTADVAQSEQFADRQAAALADIGIRAVLDLRSKERHSLAPLGKAGLHYLCMAVEPDATPSPAEIGRAAGWVRHELDDERKVLIHCSSRSTAASTLVAATLVRCGQSLEQALELSESQDLGDAQLDALTHYATRLGR